MSIAFRLQRARVLHTSFIQRTSLRSLSTTSSNPFNGIWPIIATPFNEDETINYTVFEKIINFYSNEVGVNGCTITGVLGESNRLLDDERKNLISIATSVSSKPICVGTSHSATYSTIKLSEQAMACGAHSVMITPSRENVPDQHNIISFYRKIFGALGKDVPIVLQDHPVSTQVHVTMDTIKTVLTDCPSVKCIKLESLPSPPKIRHLVPWIYQNKHDVTVLPGLGALYGLFDLECCAHGFMTGFAFPEILEAIYREQIINRNNRNAKLLYQQYLPLLVFEQQPTLVIRKDFYQLRGLMDCGARVRHPGKNPDKAVKEAVVKQLKDWIQFCLGKDVDLTKKLTIQVPTEQGLAK
eukprot:923325_1